MASQNGEARHEAATSDRASEIVAWKADSSEDTALPYALQARKLTQRFGVSVEVAALVVELAGQGPREVRR